MRSWRIGLALTMALPAHAALPTVAAIDAAAHAAMARTGSKGLALALIDHGKVALVRAYGVRDAAGDPLRTDTIMYGASLTKTVFAYTVMQLVDAGKVDLDRPIADMLAKPLPDYGNLDAYGHWGDLVGDERWRRITPRIVLTHSTGLANFAWLEDDGKLRIHSIPARATLIRARASCCSSSASRRAWASMPGRRCGSACSIASA